MSKEQILQAEGDALSRMAGEVLQPEKNKHNEDGYKANACITFCTKCKLEMNEFGVPKPFPTMHFGRPCKHADPVPLTPANAFKWRDWAVEKYGEGFFNAMTEVMISEKPHWGGFKTEFEAKAKFMGYAIGWAEPKHYIKAAMLCKEQSNE